VSIEPSNLSACTRLRLVPATTTIRLLYTWRQLAVGQFTSAEGSTTAVLQSSTHGAEPTGSTESTGSTVVGGASGTSLGSASFETGIGSGIIVTPTINGAATSSTVGVGVGTSSSAASASSATTRLGGTTIAVSKAEPQSYVCE
jgi:hypothetical protein